MSDKKLKLDSLIKYGLILAGILGGIVGIGDRLYAKKETVAKIETKVENIEKSVMYIEGIFRDYDKVGKVDKRR